MSSGRGFRPLCETFKSVGRTLRTKCLSQSMITQAPSGTEPEPWDKSKAPAQLGYVVATVGYYLYVH